MTDWVQKQMPEPDKLFSHLEKAFDKLDNNSEKIPSAGHQVESSLDGARRQLEDGDEDNWKLEIDPFLVFNLTSERDFADGNGQARIGGNINVCEGEYKMFSTTLILAIKHPMEEDNNLSDDWDQCCIESREGEIGEEFYHVLERFHWDIDTGDEEDERKPACHVQVGGCVSDSAFETYENYHYCSNGLDKPRIPHPPMDPTLIFNLLIDQYHSMESFNQAQWAGVVHRAEETLWESYFEATHGMINTDFSVMNLWQTTE